MACGLALMWTNDVEIEFLWHSDRIMNCLVNDLKGNHLWNLLACHGTPYEGEIRSFEKVLRD